MNRRTFLTMGLVPLLRPIRVFANSGRVVLKPAEKSDPSPIQKIKMGDLQTEYTGDRPHAAHAILWNLKTIAEKQAWPKAGEKQEVVVIGGGIAGLMAAYHLKKYKPILLDQAAQFGGNAKAEKIGDLTHSLATAYIGPPQKGDPVDTFFRKLGVSSKYKVKEEDFDFMLTDEPVSDATKKKFEDLRVKLIELYNEGYPELPNHPSPDPKSRFMELDGISFEDWLKKQGMDLKDPIVSNFMKNYCASIYGGTPADVSAAQVLNFFTSDVQSVYIAEGGNSVTTQALYQDLKKNLPADHLRNHCMVVNVRYSQDSKDPYPVLVTYFDQNNELRTVAAKKAVVCTPKFIAKKIVSVMPDAQKKAIDKIETRPYLVANVVFRKKIKTLTYDLFSYSSQYSFTDVIFANWIKGEQGDHSVLTVYRPQIGADARAKLLSDDSYAAQKKLFADEIKRVLARYYPKQNLEKEIVDIRVTRWGHPMPVPKVGLVKDGTAATASKTIDGKIYFVSQDNVLNGSLESCLYAALQCAKEIG